MMSGKEVKESVILHILSMCDVQTNLSRHVMVMQG